MRNYIGYIIDYSDGNLTPRKRKWFESELALNVALREEFNLFTQVNSLMRGKSDLDEIRRDIELKEVDVITKQMVSMFHKNPERLEHIQTFVENSLIQDPIDFELQKNLIQTSDEAKKHSLIDITKGWVSEWNNNNEKKNAEADSRKNFISSSLNTDIQSNNTLVVKNRKGLAIRIAGFAAAALIAGIFIIRTLTPSNNPDNIYQDFYKPLNAYTSTTRNSENVVDPFSSAVEKYKQGQYQIAGVMFSDLIYEDPSNISYRFFSGLAQMELANYEKSIELFSEVISNNKDFKKEAQWYLGLAYIKTNELQKASILLNELSKEKGYYQTLAQDLLERIK